MVRKDDGEDWFLQEWVRHLGRRQSDLVSELGWHKTAAHRLWHGRQPYRRDHVNAVAAWLGIRSYELLMPPAEALALRTVKDAAMLIADQATI
jgi:hypothetical protein